VFYFVISGKTLPPLSLSLSFKHCKYFYYLQSEIKQLQKELVKTKSNIFTLASNVAETVTTGLEGARKSSEKELDPTHVVVESLGVQQDRQTRSAQNSPFRHKKQPPGPVELLSYRRKSLL
jgi:hypothetical protein